MKELVSIVVPFYNVEKYLGDCLESISKQTYENIEVVLIDDGSTDKSTDIANSYAQKYNYFHAYRQENKGVSGARNEGIRHATGKYIYFLDSDDYVENDAIEKLVDMAEKDDLDAIKFSAYNFYEQSEEKVWNCDGYKYAGVYDRIYSGEEILKEFEKTGDKNLVIIAHIFIKRDVIARNNLFFREGIIHEDISFNWELLCLCNRVMVYNQPIHYKRTRAGSIMTTLENHVEIKAMIESIIEANDFLKKYPNVSRKKNKWYITQYAIKSLQFWNQMSDDERKKYKDLINELRAQFRKNFFFGRLNILLFYISPSLYGAYHKIVMKINK